MLAGACNSGKSSLLNALCGQSAAIVSAEAGTTTDPVKKPIELPGLGACVIVDTPGLDDGTALGAVRSERTRSELSRADIIVAVLDAEKKSDSVSLLKDLQSYDAPVIAVLGKSDLSVSPEDAAAGFGKDVIPVSASAGLGIPELLARLSAEAAKNEATITGSLVKAGDTVVLVMPQDSQAPKGRLILPQVQTIRELLDKGCTAVCCTPERLEQTLAGLAGMPDLVITDSQVFGAVAGKLPDGCRLTSFSVLMAAYKGDIKVFSEGVKALDGLTEKSRVLIAEACSHVPRNEDIGRVKIPALLRKRIGRGVRIDFCNGADFPENLNEYDLIVHCGGCMFTRRHVLSRVRRASESGVPVTNYGILLAALAGILPRVSMPE